MRSSHASRTALSLALILAIGLAVLLRAPASSAADAPQHDLTQVDLSGHWYLLIHYKDDRSEDKSITKFRDSVWSIEPEADKNKIKITSFPYVFFNEGDELLRRGSMTAHVAWSPDERIWAEIREFVRVSDRGAKIKTLKGSREDGFESNPSGGGFGMNTLTFSQNWKLTIQPEVIKMEITDSLSGTGGLAGMDETIVYQLTERISDDELRGKYDDPKRHGTLTMVRSKQRMGQDLDPEKRAARRQQRRQSGLETLMEQSSD